MSRNSGTSRDPSSDRLEQILKGSIPQLLAAAGKTTNVVRQMQQVLGSFDHPTKIRVLFRLWAPLYESYWRLTGHERATEQCVRQLDAVGSTEKERIFRGRGIDFGTGTGLLPLLIGRLREQEILETMQDEPTSGLPDKLKRIAEQCQILHRKVSKFLLQRDPALIDSALSNWLVAHLIRDLARDCANYKIISELEQYRRLHIALSERVKLEALLEDQNFGTLAVCYVRDAMAVIKLLDSLDTISKRDKKDFLTALRMRLRQTVSITGVDLCPEMLGVARRRVGPIFGRAVHATLDDGGMFLEADVSDLSGSILTSKCDFITISQLIHLLPSDAKKLLLNLCGRLLNPDGKLVIVDEWNPTFVGANLLSADQHSGVSSCEDITTLLCLIELLFNTVFTPIDKARMREIVHGAGLVYSRIRASYPIDPATESSHVQTAHVYIKSKEDKA